MLKAAGSVTFDLLILEIKFLFFQEYSKNTQIQVNILPFRKSLQIITIKTAAFLLKINCLELLEGRK